MLPRNGIILPRNITILPRNVIILPKCHNITIRFSSFVDLLCFFCLVFAMPLSASFNMCLFAPAGKGLTSWLSYVVSNCEFVTFPLVFWVRCGTWLYRFLIFAPLLTFLTTGSILEVGSSSFHGFLAIIAIFNPRLWTHKKIFWHPLKVQNIC